jgi:hypothetical protein
MCCKEIVSSKNWNEKEITHKVVESIGGAEESWEGERGQRRRSKCGGG